jgi:hypothetical protein
MTMGGFGDGGLIEKYNSDFLSLKKGQDQRDLNYPLASKVTAKLHTTSHCYGGVTGQDLIV